jgi:CRP-like cAMP-binding protein
MNVSQLAQAIATLEAHDALRCKFSADDWQKIAPFLSLRFLSRGDTLVAEGEQERELFILAEGELIVQLRGQTIATLAAGSVVGEGTFFSGQARSATVCAAQGGVAWALTGPRYDLMCLRQPRLALELTRGLAAVLAIRMRAAILVGHFA